MPLLLPDGSSMISLRFERYTPETVKSKATSSAKTFAVSRAVQHVWAVVSYSAISTFFTSAGFTPGKFVSSSPILKE